MGSAFGFQSQVLRFGKQHTYTSQDEIPPGRHLMKRVPIYFLPVQVPGSRKTRRETELERSKAKAHTSRVSYPRKHTSKTATEYSVGDNYVEVPIPIRNGQLDPFIRLAIDLSETDRNLLHLYLTTKPKSVYGTSGESVFCPVRDLAIPHFETNSIYIQWHLLLSESDQAASHARRAKIYRLMREMVSKEENWMLDSTIFTLAAAGISENRSGSDLGRKHLTAVMKLLSMREGLKTLQWMNLETGISVFCALVMWEKELAAETVTIPRGRLLPEPLRHYFEVGSYRGAVLRAQLANLHCVNGILERVNGNEFLKDLEKTLQDTMPPYTVLCAVGRCAAHAGYWRTDVMRMWEAIEFVEGVVKMECASNVMEVMSGWLTGKSEVPQQDVVEQIKQEMTEDNWRGQRIVSMDGVS